jgi:hypothetical protein
MMVRLEPPRPVENDGFVIVLGRSKPMKATLSHVLLPGQTKFIVTRVPVTTQYYQERCYVQTDPLAMFESVDKQYVCMVVSGRKEGNSVARFYYEWLYTPRLVLASSFWQQHQREL